MLLMYARFHSQYVVCTLPSLVDWSLFQIMTAVCQGR